MMINVLDGRDIRSVSREELQRISEQLMKITRTLNQEIGMRNASDSFVYGWKNNDGSGTYTTFDTLQEAWAEAEKQLGSGGGYRVQKVHL
jgi:hypothetical protein